MTFHNLGSFAYRPERNRVYFTNPSELRVIEKYGKSAIKRALYSVVSELKGEDESDVHLEGCIVTSNVLRKYFDYQFRLFNVLIYPKSERVKYQLKRSGKFYKNLHQQRSPIIVLGLECSLKNNSSQHTWLQRGVDIQNSIEGMSLFSENPYDNPPKYFEEVIDYDPFEKHEN